MPPQFWRRQALPESMFRTSALIGASSVQQIEENVKALDNLDFSGTLPAGDQLRSTGSMFLHGVSGGLEARW